MAVFRVSRERSLIAIVLVGGLGWSVPAAAYVGDSFLSIPGYQGHWQGKEFKGWVRARGSEWVGYRTPLSSNNAGNPLEGNKLFFGGPNAPKPGKPAQLALMLTKGDPDLPYLMKLCADKTPLSELTYSESADIARPNLELGKRPADIPAFYRYKLKNVTVVGCPVVKGASDQAIELGFNDIEWLNFDPNRPYSTKLMVRPADIPDIQPAVATGRKRVKSFLVTWLGMATDTQDTACPVMNDQPSDEEVLRYRTPAEIAAIKANGGVFVRSNLVGSQTGGFGGGSIIDLRGPDHLDVRMLPGIVPDPGLHEPTTNIALGVNLDGWDGTGKPPKGIRPHKKFTSPDGRTGIDNQALALTGCVPGLRGKQGYRNQTINARRADGNITTIVEISDIDDEKNDDHVVISLIHSRDKPIRDVQGQSFIPNYTFRPSEDPNYALYNVRVTGRIVNGAIISDRMPLFQGHSGQESLFELHDAMFRFDPQPDGSLKGVVAGYMTTDALQRYMSFAGGTVENYMKYRIPSMYYAIRRLAEKKLDPAVDEYNGISVVYEIDTIPAFLTPGTIARSVASNAATNGQQTKREH